MDIFGSKTNEAKSDGEIFLGVGKGNGGAGTPVAKGCGGGESPKSVGHGGRAVPVAIENDPEAKVDHVTESGIELPLPPAASKFFISKLAEERDR
jgi:hypothetical protein